MAALWITCAAGAAPAPASRIAWTSQELTKAGMDTNRLQLGVMSSDSKLLVCYEKEASAQKIAQGEVYHILLFHLDWEKGTAKIDSVVAPGITRLDNLALTGDNKWLVIVGDFGARFSAIDLTTNTGHVIFQNKVGQAGFRCTPTVFFLDRKGTRVCTVGYWIDDQGLSNKDSVVSIDPAGSGLSAITPLTDITALDRAMNLYRTALWYAPDEAFFGAYRPDKQVHLYYYDGTGTLKHLDHTARVDGMAAGLDRLLYGVSDAPKKRRTYVRDLVTNKSWAIEGPNHVDVRYPYMSRDGSVILLSDMGFQTLKMTVFYGREEGSFNLRPIPGLVGVYPGTIRFSSGGEALAFFNKEGLQIVRVPR
jgi:hypothetical protein